MIPYRFVVCSRDDILGVFLREITDLPYGVGGVLSVGVTVFFAFVLAKETLSVGIHTPLCSVASLLRKRCAATLTRRPLCPQADISPFYGESPPEVEPLNINSHR